MPVPTTLSFLGFAQETTPGTAVAATDFMPIKTLEPYDHIQFTPDQNLRGSFVKTYNELQTFYYSEYSFAGDLFVDKFNFPMRACLGDYTFTTGGGSAPNSHVHSVLNSGTGQPKTLTLSDYNGFNTRQYAFSLTDEINVKFSAEGLLEYTAKMMGLLSATTTKPTQSFSTDTPRPVWASTVTLGGASTSVLQDGEFTIKRNVAPIFTAGNVQNPYKIWTGACEVSGKMTLVYEDDTFLTQFEGGTSTSIDLLFSNGGATTALRTFQFHASNVLYTVAKPVRTKDFVELDIEFEAVANTSDAGTSGGYSPCKITMKSLQATL